MYVLVVCFLGTLFCQKPLIIDIPRIEVCKAIKAEVQPQAPPRWRARCKEHT